MAITIEHTLLTNPNVVVTFTGLLVLRFDPKGKFCDVGVHPSPEHRLRIFIEKWERTTNRKIETLGTFSGKLAQDLTIKFTNHPPVTQYEFSGPLVRKLPVSKMSRRVMKDLRWAINFQDFHVESLVPKESLFSPKIRIEGGAFRTEELFEAVDFEEKPIMTGVPKIKLTGKNFKKLYKKNNMKKSGITLTETDGLNLFSIATILAADIKLGKSDKVQFVIGDGLGLALNLDAPPKNCYYKIALNNDCITEEVLQAGPGELQSDLPFYYEVISAQSHSGRGFANFAVGDQVTLGFGEHFSKYAPCASIII